MVSHLGCAQVPKPLIGDPIPRYTAMSKALNTTGRPIYFAMCEWGSADPAICMGPGRREFLAHQ